MELVNVLMHHFNGLVVGTVVGVCSDGVNAGNINLCTTKLQI